MDSGNRFFQSTASRDRAASSPRSSPHSPADRGGRPCAKTALEARSLRSRRWSASTAIWKMSKRPTTKVRNRLTDSETRTTVWRRGAVTRPGKRRRSTRRRIAKMERETVKSTDPLFRRRLKSTLFRIRWRVRITDRMLPCGSAAVGAWLMVDAFKASLDSGHWSVGSPAGFSQEKVG